MDSFCTTCNQIDTDLGLNLYHDHHDYLVMSGEKVLNRQPFLFFWAMMSSLRQFWRVNPSEQTCRLKA